MVGMTRVGCRTDECIRQPQECCSGARDHETQHDDKESKRREEYGESEEENSIMKTKYNLFLSFNLRALRHP